MGTPASFAGSCPDIVVVFFVFYLSCLRALEDNISYTFLQTSGSLL